MNKTGMHEAHCTWENDGIGCWWTDCHYVVDGIPSDMLCPFCGAQIAIPEEKESQ